jgi:hypothetical protein
MLERNTVKLGPLTLFERMHSNGTLIRSWVIAAVHWEWSITWRWSLTCSTAYHMRPFWPRASYTRTYRGYPGNVWCFQSSVHVPWLGSVNLSAQPNMPWKSRA